MKQKAVLLIGILGVLLLFSAVVAFARNSSEDARNPQYPECTPEMMENMASNCPEEMMRSGECETMMDGAKDCSEMMGLEEPGEENTDTKGMDHCDGQETDEITNSGSADLKGNGMM